MDQIITTLVTIFAAMIQIFSSLFGNLGGLGDLLGGTKTPELGWPVKNQSQIVTAYDATKHQGVDIEDLVADKGLGPIIASADGTVSSAVSTPDAKLGRYIIINHDKTIETVYANCWKISVKSGETVTKGQTIGYIGNSAGTAKAYLHYEVKTQNTDGTYSNADPTKYITNPFSGQTSSSGTFTFTVYGYGHGVGMSQKGALAMATKGSKYDEILKTYYKGITIKTDSSASASNKVKRGDTEMTLLDFLCRTVKQEIGVGSTATIEALKAQTVAAYSFAKSTGSYSGQAFDATYNYTGTTVEKAVKAVIGQYADYNGEVAQTVYFASSAGKTTSATNTWGGTSLPYLVGGVSSPETVEKTTVTYTSAQMKKLILANNSSADLSGDPSTWLLISNQDKAVSDSIGYVSKMSVGGKTMTGYNFRKNVLNYGIKSHCFTITYEATAVA